MEFAYSEKVQKLQARVSAFMEQHVYPNEQTFQREVDEGDRWQPTRIVEELKKKAQAAGAVESVSAAVRSRRRADQSRVRAAVRDHGPRALGAGSVQLLGARYRQHGSAGALRHAGAQEAVARAAARRRDPLVLRDDRAGGRVVGCDQHREPHRAAGRSLRHQRSQVVVFGRARSALQDLHLHGQDRSRTTPTSTSSSR